MRGRVEGIWESLFPGLEIHERIEGDSTEKVISGAWNP